MKNWTHTLYNPVMQHFSYLLHLIKLDGNAEDNRVQLVYLTVLLSWFAVQVFITVPLITWL